MGREGTIEQLLISSTKALTYAINSTDWYHVLENAGRLVASFALAFPIGWERGKRKTGAGLRTFPIVAMASCGYVLVCKDLPDFGADAVSRVIQGLVAGIGFVGGGAIIKEGGSVQGVSTAASVWNTGAIGLAVAYEAVETAIVLALINYLALLALTPLSNEETGNKD